MRNVELISASAVAGPKESKGDSTTTSARRRFRKADTVRSLETWVGRALGLDMRRHQLATSFPRKALTDPDATLEQAGVRDKDALAVEPKRG